MEFDGIDEGITSSDRDRLEDDEKSSDGNHPHDLSCKLGPSNSVYGLLKCSACLDLIHQCCYGHPLCSTCTKKVNRCPACKADLISDIKGLMLEKVEELLELPCTYSSAGCPEILPSCRMLEHEEACNFRPYNCPNPGPEGCFTGDIPNLVTHLIEYHKVVIKTGCTFYHRFLKSNLREAENASWRLKVYHCFGQYFCLHCEAFQLGTTPVYMVSLRFMGAETDARNFSYSLKVGENGTKLTWEGTPRSIRYGHWKVGDMHDGLILMRNMAPSFSSGDTKEVLRVKGRIWEEK